MYKEYLLNEKDINKRSLLLLHPDSRKEIRNALGLSVGSFNNNITNLRKKGWFNQHGVNPKLLPTIQSITPGKLNSSLIFKFIIDAEESK